MNTQSSSAYLIGLELPQREYFSHSVNRFALSRCYLRDTYIGWSDSVTHYSLWVLGFSIKNYPYCRIVMRFMLWQPVPKNPSRYLLSCFVSFNWISIVCRSLIFQPHTSFFRVNGPPQILVASSDDGALWKSESVYSSETMFILVV